MKSNPEKGQLAGVLNISGFVILTFQALEFGHQ
jgi:hypothetical protein